MERKKYNLRSAKSDGVQTPIQLQLSKDNDFLKNLLEAHSPGHTQQASDQISFTRDLHCSTSMDESDDACTQVCSFDKLVVDSPRKEIDMKETLLKYFILQ